MRSIEVAALNTERCQKSKSEFGVGLFYGLVIGISLGMILTSVLAQYLWK